MCCNRCLQTTSPGCSANRYSTWKISQPTCYGYQASATRDKALGVHSPPKCCCSKEKARFAVICNAGLAKLEFVSTTGFHCQLTGTVVHAGHTDWEQKEDRNTTIVRPRFQGQMAASTPKHIQRSVTESHEVSFTKTGHMNRTSMRTLESHGAQTALLKQCEGVVARSTAV